MEPVMPAVQDWRTTPLTHVNKGTGQILSRYITYYVRIHKLSKYGGLLHDDNFIEQNKNYQAVWPLWPAWLL